MPKKNKGTLSPTNAFVNSFKLKRDEFSIPTINQPAEKTKSRVTSFYPPPLRPSRRYNYAYIVGEAKRRPPKTRIPQATAFSSWIYGLTHKPQRWLRNEADVQDYTYKDGQRDAEEEQRMELGRFVEKQIEEFRLWYKQRYQNPICMEPGYWRSYWTLEFADPLDNKSEQSKTFLASRLRINGEPLRCRPDVVLRNKSTNDIIIIERKVTFTDVERIPKEGWPNLLAQLWCYSWIDDWVTAPNVLLIGQIWKPECETHPRLVMERGVLRGVKMQSELKIPREPLELYPRYRRADDAFHKQQAELFRLYGGEFSD